MTNIHHLPDTETAEREAGDWIARLNADDVCAEDRARFAVWRDAHPRHARAYEDLASTWGEFKDAGRIVRAVSFGAAMNVVPVEARAPVFLRRALPIAAALAMIVLAATWWIARIAPGTEFQTAIGEHASVGLPDGSSLELNSNSRARVDYTAEARVIHLERGEAFFAVAHDTQRPFWVVAGNSWVRAVGTAFNVYLRPTGVRVTVSEGTVKVASELPAHRTPSDAALSLAPVSVLTVGQQADVQGRVADIRSLQPVELTRSVAWRQGVLNFNNEPLGAAVEEINRYTTVQIIVIDPALQRLPIGGTFQASPQGAEALLTLLADGLGLTVRREGAHRAYVEGEVTK